MMRVGHSVRVLGKVMIWGEYAVLHGGPALLLPVPRVLQVSEATSPPANPYPPPLAEALLQSIPETAAYESAHGLPHVTVDRSAFYATSFRETGDSPANRPAKLGLGSSAAEAVGVTALRLERAGLDSRRVWELVAGCALEAHERAQRGLGSGADVTACAAGVPLLFRRSAGIVEARTDLARRSPHAEIPMALVWSATPADTRSRVARFEKWLQQRGRREQARLALLIEDAAALEQAWPDGSRDEIFLLLDTFCARLEECQVAAGIHWKSSQLQALRAWARHHGGRAKATGAGGGDMILLLGDLPYDELGTAVIPLTSTYHADHGDRPDQFHRYFAPSDRDTELAHRVSSPLGASADFRSD